MVHFGLGLGWLRLWCILGSFDPWAGLRSVYPNLTLIFTWPQYSLETDLDRLLWPKIVCFDPIKSTLWQGSSALVRIVCFDPWIVCFGPGSSALILFEDRLLWPSRIVCFGPYSSAPPFLSDIVPIARNGPRIICSMIPTWTIQHLTGNKDLLQSK